MTNYQRKKHIRHMQGLIWVGIIVAIVTLGVMRSVWGMGVAASFFLVMLGLQDILFRMEGNND